jgi:hypothetical protein
MVGLLGGGISPVPRPLPTQDNTTQRNTNTHTSMPRAGFELAIPIFERPKTVLALDRASIETGQVSLHHKIRKKIPSTIAEVNSNVDEEIVR